jgi:hypothetical protein
MKKYKYDKSAVARIARLCTTIARANQSEDKPVWLPRDLRKVIENAIAGATPNFNEGTWVGPIGQADITRRLGYAKSNDRAARKFLNTFGCLYEHNRETKYVRTDTIPGYSKCFDDVPRVSI